MERKSNLIFNLFSRLNLQSKKVLKGKKSAFTIAELVTTMVVIAMVILITLPITLNKMKVVDYSSYYLGYAFIKDISSNIMPDFLKKLKDNESAYAFEINGTRYGTPFWPKALTKAECEAQKSTLGITSCPYDNDYWAGAVAQCGGTANMPTDAQLIEIANYIYNTTVTVASSSPAVRDDEKAKALGFTVSSSSSKLLIWTGQERDTVNNSYSRHLNPTSETGTGWLNACYDARTYSTIQAVCVVN